MNYLIIIRFFTKLKLLHIGSIPVRRKILIDFIEQHQNKTGTEIEEEMAYAASLFLTRITSWLRLS